MNATNHFSVSGRSCALALAVLACPFVLADDSYWYIGGSIGQSAATIDDQQIQASLLTGGFTTTSLVDDDHDQGFKLFGAYRFGPHFAIEGGYFDLGEFGFTATTLPAGTLTGTAEFSGFNLDAVGFLPLSERFTAFGRIGYNAADAEVAFAGTGAVIVTMPSASGSESGLKMGIGLEYEFTERFAGRVEAERYQVGDALGNEGDIDLFTLGVVYRFSDRDQPPAAKTVAAAPVVTQAPAPMVVVVPVAKTAKYCTVLDIEFEINNSGIQREESERLAVIANFMREYPETSAVIQGHSDDVGSETDNLALSQRRAQSVVDYLVDTENIARSRLSAIGYGEGYPIADNSTFQGKQANRRIGAVIACATDLAGLKPVKARVTMALEIEFDPYKHAILPSSRDEMRKLADFLKAHPLTNAVVEGHGGKFVGLGDDQTVIPPDVAMTVSKERAQAVVDYLVTEFGIARSRLAAQGYGQTRRVAYGTTLEGQEANRRINVIIQYPDTK